MSESKKRKKRIKELTQSFIDMVYDNPERDRVAALKHLCDLVREDAMKDVEEGVVKQEGEANP